MVSLDLYFFTNDYIGKFYTVKKIVNFVLSVNIGQKWHYRDNVSLVAGRFPAIPIPGLTPYSREYYPPHYSIIILLIRGSSDILLSGKKLVIKLG